MQAIAGQIHHTFPSDTGHSKPQYFLTKTEFISRKVYVNESCYNTYLKIEQNKDSDYHLNYLYNQIEGLRNTCANLTSFHADRNHIRKIKMIGGQIFYRVSGSDSYIDFIEVTDDVFNEDVEKLRAPGLYSATHDQDQKEWDVEQQIDDIAGSKSFTGTHHIGVNGEADNALVAANILPYHVVRGGQVTSGQLENTGYNLFYCPDKDGKDEGWDRLVPQIHSKDTKEIRSEIGKRIASVMELYASYGADASWTIQGTADEIMTEALDYLARKSPVTADKDQLDFSSQMIYFSNPINDLTKAKMLVDKVGLTYAHKDKLFDSSPFLGIKYKAEVANDRLSGTNPVSAYSKPVLALSGAIGKVLGATALDMGASAIAKLLESGMNELNSAKKSSLYFANVTKGNRRALAQVSCENPQEAAQQLSDIKTMTQKMNTRLAHA